VKGIIQQTVLSEIVDFSSVPSNAIFLEINICHQFSIQILSNDKITRLNYPHPVKVSLNMLRFHQILRPN